MICMKKVILDPIVQPFFNLSETFEVPNPDKIECNWFKKILKI